jgi:hypothetical protein
MNTITTKMTVDAQQAYICRAEEKIILALIQ